MHKWLLQINERPFLSNIVGKVPYKLNLPQIFKLHLMFHVNMLKLFQEDKEDWVEKSFHAHQLEARSLMIAMSKRSFRTETICTGSLGTSTWLSGRDYPRDRSIGNPRKPSVNSRFRLRSISLRTWWGHHSSLVVENDKWPRTK